jgi:hypothetical protein
MQRLQNSWALAKTSWGVLQQDRELLWLPVLSFLSCVGIGALLFVPILFSGTSENAFGDRELDLGPMQYVLLFAAYVAIAYVGIFFRAAILHAADERLRGGNPSLGSGLRGASQRAGRLLPWAIFSVTVSMILRAIEERAGFLGRIVAGIVGLAWTLVTFLVLPVLVLEDVGVFQAVRRSADLFKRTWGENVAAQLGFGLLGMVAVIPGVLVAVLFGGTGNGVLLVTGIVLAVAWIGVVSVVLSALGAIFQMALYHYAVDGVAPEAFRGAGLEQAFAPRQNRTNRGPFGGLGI